MVQQAQVFELNPRRSDGRTLWAYRYRTGGRTAKRIQRGGFASEQDARSALERTLEKMRLRQGRGRTPTLAELVEQYLAQHEASQVTPEKLRWLLTHAVGAFGERRLDELAPDEIGAWRMTIRPGYRFEATQALRQVLQRAVVWGLLEVNPAKLGVENPGSPPSSQLGSSPSGAVYDLRHTFVTFALRAGISTFDLSRYMGASLTMIDRHYGHLARDGREHAIRLLDSYGTGAVDVGGRRYGRISPRPTTENAAEQELTRSPLTDSSR
jgi:hypothetical protein